MCFLHAPKKRWDSYVILCIYSRKHVDMIPYPSIYNHICSLLETGQQLKTIEQISCFFSINTIIKLKSQNIFFLDGKNRTWRNMDIMASSMFFSHQIYGTCHEIQILSIPYAPCMEYLPTWSIWAWECPIVRFHHVPSSKSAPRYFDPGHAQ